MQPERRHSTKAFTFRDLLELGKGCKLKDSLQDGNYKEVTERRTFDYASFNDLAELGKERKLDDEGWVKLHGYYRIVELYSSLDWEGNVELLEKKMVCAPAGGPIAAFGNNMIQIFTSSGREVGFAQIDWELAGVGWTEDDVLVCTGKDGFITGWDIYGRQLGTFSCNEEVGFSIVWGQSIACCTITDRILVISIDADGNFTNPICQQLTENDAWHSMTPVEPNQIMVVGRSTVEHLSIGLETTIVYRWHFGSAIKDIALSQGGEIAVLTDDAELFVLSEDFCHVKTRRKLTNLIGFQSVREFVWCGEEAVLLKTSKSMLLVDLEGCYWKQECQGVQFVKEVDGIRLLFKDRMEFLFPVPSAAAQITSIENNTAAALLYQAERSGTSRSWLMQSLGSAAESAAIECFHAARLEFDSETQLSLLRPLVYIKSECSKYTKLYREWAILARLRDPLIGFPLSVPQFEVLTLHGLLMRLSRFRLHALALTICERLNIKEARADVLINWACMIITNETDPTNDVAVFKRLIAKLEDNVSLIPIARHALRIGRDFLAAQLLEKANKPREEIYLFLERDDIKSAMRGLFKLQEENERHFWHVVETEPAIYNYLCEHYRECGDMEALREVFARKGEFHKTGDEVYRIAIQIKDLQRATERREKLEDAHVLYKFLKFDGQDDKIRLCAEAMLLHDFQVDAQTLTGDHFLGLSVLETFNKLQKLGLTQMFDKLKVYNRRRRRQQLPWCREMRETCCACRWLSGHVRISPLRSKSCTSKAWRAGTCHQEADGMYVVASALDDTLFLFSSLFAD